ncbi:annexin D3-like isoform X2 [Andrographis paniculata]|uniref:annexin D3-like isoform X2 n=1 Tax=Andrographis paniculata TaxID=175694 RepID=UPI0021E6FA08|nr:annexin D3-like isoform X2 [Andrographis paniculata]
MATLTFPEAVPSPVDDCETLNAAFTGLGTDEKAIIRTLGHRNANQRKQIRDTYELLYDKYLADHLHSELSGDFGKAVVLWIYDAPERDARLANSSLKSMRKGVAELQVIVEIACVASPQYLLAVRQCYCFLFDCSLEEDIVSEVPLPVRKVLVSLVSSFRHDKEVVNSTVASEEAIKLHESIEAKKLDDDELIMVLSTRNVFQLRETFKFYRDSYGRSLDQDIADCGHGVLESLLRAVVLCIDSPLKHFSEGWGQMNIH